MSLKVCKISQFACIFSSVFLSFFLPSHSSFGSRNGSGTSFAFQSTNSCELFIAKKKKSFKTSKNVLQTRRFHPTLELLTDNRTFICKTSIKRTNIQNIFFMIFQDLHSTKQSFELSKRRVFFTKHFLPPILQFQKNMLILIQTQHIYFFKNKV